ncbi:hypothetical protein H072_9591 [Dactylellina haptotyla CBS 200.50]|uniref:Uncharacterized protein n=1 Tax=Dactylellina haptotyla (strain CBS 200.50) TaxID=1284197 RepID=S8A1B8_DACHA|nr:hypothetical protein H072_9591 [Dactylellina haptotyla CBS 200.50]
MRLIIAASILIFDALSGALPLDENSMAYIPEGSTSHDDKLVYKGESCKLGLWQHGTRDSKGAAWEGYPLGKGVKDGGPEPRDPTLNNRCFNLKDLHENLPGQLSSFMLTGWCECEFFDQENCPQEATRFSAFNREDAALWTKSKEHGQDDNRIRSIKCWYTQRQDLFQWGSVRFVEEGGPDAPYRDVASLSEEQRLLRKSYMHTITPENIGFCQVLNGKLLPSPVKYVINGCSCQFFRGRERLGPRLTYTGNAGRTAYDWETAWGTKLFSYVFTGISFRCCYPWGIAWHERSDLHGLEERDVSAELPEDINDF